MLIVVNKARTSSSCLYTKIRSPTKCSI